MSTEDDDAARLGGLHRLNPILDELHGPTEWPGQIIEAHRAVDHPTIDRRKGHVDLLEHVAEGVHPEELMRPRLERSVVNRRARRRSRRRER